MLLHVFLEAKDLILPYQGKARKHPYSGPWRDGLLHSAWEGPGLCFVVRCLDSPSLFCTWWPQVVLVVKNLPAKAGDVRDAGSVPGLGRSPGEGMATHSSILAWRIPRTEQPGGLQSTGSHGVRHDWSDSALSTKEGDQLLTAQTTLRGPVGSTLCVDWIMPLKKGMFTSSTPVLTNGNLFGDTVLLWMESSGDEVTLDYVGRYFYKKT